MFLDEVFMCEKIEGGEISKDISKVGGEGNPVQPPPNL